MDAPAILDAGNIKPIVESYAHEKHKHRNYRECKRYRGRMLQAVSRLTCHVGTLSISTHGSDGEFTPNAEESRMINFRTITDRGGQRFCPAVIKRTVDDQTTFVEGLYAISDWSQKDRGLRDEARTKNSEKP